tara:strand:- start:24 stop:302 length:279 start_codon:yes stop_codon:yes gene_type:complete
MNTLSNESKFQDFAIIVKYVKPTSIKGSRVSISSPYFNKKKLVGFSYEFNSIGEQFAKMLIDAKIELVSYGQLPNQDIFMVNWDDGKKFFNI